MCETQFTKRLISILLLLVFIYSTAGYFISFRICSQRIKESVLSMLNAGEFNEEELSVLSFDSEALIPYCDAHEIILNGILYDIEKKEMKGEKIILYCYADSQEQQLNDDFSRRVENNAAHPSSSNEKNTIHKKISGDFIARMNRIIHMHAIAWFQASSVVSDPQQPAFTEIQSPPPRL